MSWPGRAPLVTWGRWHSTRVTRCPLAGRGSRVSYPRYPANPGPRQQSPSAGTDEGRTDACRTHKRRRRGCPASVPGSRSLSPAAASFADETLLHRLRTGRTQSGARVGWVVPGLARVVGFELIDVDRGSARVPLLGGLCRVPQEW